MHTKPKIAPVPGSISTTTHHDLKITKLARASAATQRPFPHGDDGGFFTFDKEKGSSPAACWNCYDWASQTPTASVLAIPGNNDYEAPLRQIDRPDAVFAHMQD